MPYFETSQEWLDQSVLLIQAYPTTTRITTRYSIKKAKKRPKPAPAADPSAATAPAAVVPRKPPRATLVIKTYDPVSGVTLKYSTVKAAEVSRLMGAAMRQLGRAMAALPEVPEVDMPDAAATAAGNNKADDQQQQANAQKLPSRQQQGQQAGSSAGGAAGGGKKKKRGKK